MPKLLTLSGEVTVIYGEPDVALVLAESDDYQHLLCCLEGVDDLANHAQIGRQIEVENVTPEAGVSERLTQLCREYRWDWNLTPNDCSLLVVKVKVLAAV